MSFFDIFFGPVNSYLSEWPEFSVKHYLTPLDFSEYAALIDSGTPVIVSSFGFPGHTLIVEGYSSDAEGNYIYVHDPSGYFSKFVWGTGRTQFARVEWAVFSKVRWTELVIKRARLR